MKVSCTHFQCAAGAFAYLREHFPHAYSVDMSRQILTLNVNLMLVRRCPWWSRVEARRGDSSGWSLDQAPCTWWSGRDIRDLGFDLRAPGGAGLCFLEWGERLRSEDSEEGSL